MGQEPRRLARQIMTRTIRADRRLLLVSVIVKVVFRLTGIGVKHLDKQDNSLLRTLREDENSLHESTV